MIRSVTVTSFEQWRQTARRLLAEDAHPNSVHLSELPQDSLFEPAVLETVTPFTVPKAFVKTAECVAMHRDPRRWDLLYRMLYRIVRNGERHLLRMEIDPDTRSLELMKNAVDRDVHKMHAFVRFRKIAGEPEQFVAWHRPDHYIVEHVAPWFLRRFGIMRWAILTPDRSAYWDLQTLRYGPGVPSSEAPQEDALEDLWRSYYASIFNPARANLSATIKELPVRHWATLPEARMIPQMLLEASSKEKQMRQAQPPSAEPFLPGDRSLPVLAESIHRCHGCDLYRHATQPVFGEGPAKARIMFVGEQPGDQEDLHGKPFIGPAGQLWNRALREAQIDRSQVYVTNAVKHFKFEERGKRRIHQKPRGVEVAACRPWLTAEIEQVDPRIMVALGATAALSVGGREFGIQKERGKLLPLGGGRQLLVTVHPSYLLRLRDGDRDAEFDRFVSDLRLVA